MVVSRAQLRHALDALVQGPPEQGAFRTGLAGWDGLAPTGQFRRGAVHELLSPALAPTPKLLAVRLARAAQQAGGCLVWSDPSRELYPPALVAAGVDLSRLIVLRPRTLIDELWALTECLRCRGVSATIAAPGARLSRVAARRLQLAAERGGGIGVFMRPHVPGAFYAAATRWLARPAVGDRDVQRWSVELLHGHGGRVGEVVLLEVDRDDANALRIPETVADRPALPTTARATA